MELSVQTSQLRYLRRVAHELRYQEETADTIVPDSYPDISAITDCFASVVLRGKDCREGAVTVSGGIKASLLYEPEDGSGPRRLELYIPFTMKYENPALTERSRVQCELRVRSVDGRMINSRKAMLRVNLGCEMNAYEDAEQTLYSLQDPPVTLQTKANSCQIRVPLESCERSFVISDALELPNGRPALGEIYKVICKPEITDRKLVGNKGIFKGTLWCKIVYFSQDHSLNLWQHQLPFSQYCEFSGEYDEETLSVLPVITGYDLEPEPGSETTQMSFTLHLLAQCMVMGTKSVQMIEDAFSTEGTLHPQWTEFSVEAALDALAGTQSVRHRISGQLRDAADVEVYPDFPSSEHRDDQSRVCLPMYIRVLGYDSDGRLQSLTGKTEAVHSFALHEQAEVSVRTRPVTDAYVTVGSDGIEVQYSTAMDCTFYSTQKLKSLSGGTVDPFEDRKERPAIILRLSGKEETLWSIAKNCGASLSAVQAANHLESDRLQEGVMLLIPVG